MGRGAWYFIMQISLKSGLGATGSEIWLKIHLRGATEGSESPITAARGCCKQPTGFFRHISLVVEPKTDFCAFFLIFFPALS